MRAARSAPPGREVPSCSACGSTVRLRSLIALLSREIFGVELAIPDFPVLKGIRGFGMSDPPELAQRLAEKFEYTNTFYHQEPRLDVVDPSPEHLREHTGRYDFILSSEVLEHVSPPVERAFANLNRMLKPDGLVAAHRAVQARRTHGGAFSRAARIRAGLARRAHRAGESPARRVARGVRESFVPRRRWIHAGNACLHRDIAEGDHRRGGLHQRAHRIGGCAGVWSSPRRDLVAAYGRPEGGFSAAFR